MADKSRKSCRCAHCKNEVTAILHRQVFHNGSVGFTWVCDGCKRKNPGGGTLYIPKETIEKHLNSNEVDALPTLMPDLACRCAVCGSRDVELHHWMPQALHKEANSWPKDYLCKKCHDVWHRVVTPDLVKGGEL